MNFKEKSESEILKYQAGTKSFPRYPIYIGVEIEQATRRHPDAGSNQVCFSNPNPTGLLPFLPQEVVNRSTFYKWSEGHWDLSTPWEFKLGYDEDPIVLMNRFDTIVGKNKWIWHSVFTNNETRGASSHVHFSLRGDINLGAPFDFQKTAPYHFWTIYWNDLVSILPYITPFFANGNYFRDTCFKGRNRWAMPVIDRFDYDDVARLFSGDTINGKFSDESSATREFVIGHKYYALSWNRKGITSPRNEEGKPKKAVTIELRLCETHPYWFLPAVQKINIMLKKTLVRRSSIKLKNHFRIEDDWKMITDGNGIYESLFKMKNIEFHENRGIPDLTREGQEKVFETGLDLFRAICRRFANTNRSESWKLKSNKVLRMFSDFIDLGRLPAHLVWNIDEAYRLLYLDENKKTNQDTWLHFGSKVVLPDSVTRTTKDYTMTRLLEG